VFSETLLKHLRQTLDVQNWFRHMRNAKMPKTPEGKSKFLRLRAKQHGEAKPGEEAQATRESMQQQELENPSELEQAVTRKRGFRDILAAGTRDSEAEPAAQNTTKSAKKHALADPLQERQRILSQEDGARECSMQPGTSHEEHNACMNENRVQRSQQNVQHHNQEVRIRSRIE
jgi:hypothetical protein